MKEIINRLKQGDKSAEKEFFDYLYVRFCRISKLRVKEEDIQDLAQSACLTILEKLDRGLSEVNFEAWAYTILRNKIGNYYQSERKRLDIIESLSNAGKKQVEPENEGLRREVVKCMKLIIKSHNNYARILNLIHLGYSADEISEKIGLTPNYVYVTLNRGRKLLKYCLVNGKLK